MDILLCLVNLGCQMACYSDSESTVIYNEGICTLWNMQCHRSIFHPVHRHGMYDVGSMYSTVIPP
jgi:hypothetical protein